MEKKIGMQKPNKWKYLFYFQNDEFNELISKEIIQKIYERKEKISSLEEL